MVLCSSCVLSWALVLSELSSWVVVVRKIRPPGLKIRCFVVFIIWDDGWRFPGEVWGVVLLLFFVFVEDGGIIVVRFGASSRLRRRLHRLLDYHASQPTSRLG